MHFWPGNNFLKFPTEGFGLKEQSRMSHSHGSLWANANLVSARRVSKLQSNNNRYFPSTDHRFVEMRLRLRSRLRASHNQVDLVVQDDLHSFLQVLQILLTCFPSSLSFRESESVLMMSTLVSFADSSAWFTWQSSQWIQESSTLRGLWFFLWSITFLILSVLFLFMNHLH